MRTMRVLCSGYYPSDHGGPNGPVNGYKQVGSRRVATVRSQAHDRLIGIYRAACTCTVTGNPSCLMQSTARRGVSTDTWLGLRHTHMMLLRLARLNFHDTPEIISQGSIPLHRGAHPLKCSCDNCVAFCRNASYRQFSQADDTTIRTMPASTHTAFNCAPFISSVDRASSSKLHSSALMP